ncbi:hypothetical protein BS47DRAFT_1373961 [Hydnum rufescens UP504]|uniref:ornithine decarboxylase n=1 Tax=Hydnum rufescens UP504 TaxID=1448309 RepID=A0A9P6AJU9_9AGAM|nr:hypothetical protein BS47DRAFT_1373961 [Hydnum rufescens UP504]
MGSRILQAAVDAEKNLPNAEKAFFIADLTQIYKQFERWNRCLPNVEPFYAVKCNPDPYVVRLLAALGTGFDCASLQEIRHVMQVGVHPSRVIFANPCKSISFIKHAAAAGVDMMTFDNTDEIYKIARVHPGAKLVVRILTDDSKSLCRLGLKFGAPLDTVPGLLSIARSLNLDVIGVSFHVGSGSYDTNAFAGAVMRARAAFDMGAEAGYSFKLLDVGGGFESTTFEPTAGVLARALETFFPFAHKEGIRIIAEPGRYFVSSAFSLAANVIARRVKHVDAADRPLEMEGSVTSTTEDQPSVMYYINDGVYGAFNCILFDHQKVAPYPLTIAHCPVPPLIAAGATVESPGGEVMKPISGETVLASVWGPTCDSIDCVCPLTSLPMDLAVGDWLGFDHMGAYTLCAASTFNGFDVSEVHYTTGDSPVGAAVRAALSIYNEKIEDCDTT